MIIYAKGEIDTIIHKNEKLFIDAFGAPRSCGGIGDVLSGVIAAIISMNGVSSIISTSELFICLNIAGRIVRKASALAFNVKGRSMSAVDVIENIGSSFKMILE